MAPALATLACTLAALVCFAANSVLCRLALGSGAADAAGFTSLRLFSGALVLWLLLRVTESGKAPGAKGGSLRGGAALFLYAACFSFAYLKLDTATGALILFASVQLSLVGAALLGGHRQGACEWCGLGLSLGGVLFLMLPGAGAPSFSGFVLMGLAGIAWGLYCLFGRSSASPLRDTAGNFVLTLLPSALLVIAQALFGSLHMDAQGLVLSVASGALASGLGYALWYRALPALGSLQAGVLQLSVPLLAAGGGLLFLCEPLGPRLLVSSLLILGGIALVFRGRAAG